MRDIPFSDLKGKTLSKIEGAEENSEIIRFFTTDNKEYKMHHDQDCCENVTVNDIIGDISDLIGNEILTAEERTSDANPEGISKDYQDSFTWTFYELATIKGSVTIRWYGESNGYYSERVDFEEVL